ncbi:MAG: DUF4177 domain-containing protein [Ktedonobacteraceae bacterium]|nr:DUF4177 domain-containing protein [Ktedonobacteraceae bacterium]
MDTWEYKIIRQQAPPGHALLIDESQLLAMGNQGWELVNIVPIQAKSHGMGGKFLLEGTLSISTCDFIFKRRK